MSREVVSFDKHSELLLRLVDMEPDKMPRTFREAVDEALLHGWMADEATTYGVAAYFYSIGVEDA